MTKVLTQLNNKTTFTISEFGLIGTDKSVYTANKFLSAQVSIKVYEELERFAKTDKGKEVLNFSSNGKYLQAKSYVGTIQTISGYILEILPKTAKDEKINDSKKIFIKLLHLLHKLPNFKNIDSAKLSIERLDIFEIFISMFLDEVGQIIKKGVKSDYSQQEDNLFYLKGKLLINEQIKRNTIHKERFFVQYDDYNQNRAENRLIKSTLKLLVNISKDNKNIRLIRLYMEHMNWVDISMNIDNDFRMVKLGRGMEHYRNALVWAKVFLKKESFNSFSGDTIAFTILYPMEKLFECFVEWWLSNIKYPQLSVEAQTGGVYFVKNLFTVRPDFIIKHNNKVCCVADAKWKLIDKKEDFSQSDFYQLFAYKHIYSEKLENDLNCLQVYYPKSNYLDQKISYKYFDDTKIKLVPLDIKALLKI